VSLLRRKPRLPQPMPAPALQTRPPMADAARSLYVDGLSAGVEMTLDQLDPRTSRHPSGAYHGPMPEELRDWIASTRARVEGDRAERNRTAASGDDRG
jgi:hypothetical protein